ncbi:alpha/beta hydrolase [uncultured Proteiniphilum sp.]|uniref:alpha/beta fold hydrolase n=1 Tax=uncultured Proteiniphilum sp. TaxID=497637 RepID=UPI002634CA6F|nr:alpha/beta hydrolase [uncultured Proteiniphilum sp.]
MKEENNQAEKYVVSSDGSKIHYKETGKGDIAIVFVHGWLGNVNWWNDQQIYFRDRYNIVQIDLGGHGKSDKSRQNWTSKQYADDIKAVIGQIGSSEIILVGHSMSGAYVLEATINSPEIKAIILVDTLKDLEEVITYEEADQFILTHYRKDFKATVKNILPQYLFAETTPISIKERLQNEFLQNESDLAVQTIEPLYKMDIQETAKSIQVPVRAINSDATPTNIENNRKYLKDYDYTIITGTGHYPMLEKPDEFNRILENLISELTE